MFKNLLLNTPSPTTIALKADWGSGKTTFLRRVEKSLEKTAAVVFIDLWRADSGGDPLAVIANEIANAIKDNRGQFATLKAHVGSFATLIADNAASVAACAISVSGFAAGLPPSTSILAATSAVSWFSAWNKEKKEAIDTLSQNLKKLAEIIQEKSEHPIVIVLDEFDRCRPDFAVQTLERIKHYFDTAGFTFVLAIDDSAVASAVSGHYGGKLDGEKYLRRFFDFEFRLPPPSTKAVALFAATRLLNFDGIDSSKASSVLTSYWRNGLYNLLPNDDNDQPELLIIALSAIFSDAMSLSVRDQLQATTLTFTLYRSKDAKNLIDAACLSFLCFARFGNLEKFRLFEAGDLDFQSLVGVFSGLARVNICIYSYFIEFGAALRMTHDEKSARITSLSKQGRTEEDGFRRLGGMNAQYCGFGGKDGEQNLRKCFFDLNRLV